MIFIYSLHRLLSFFFFNELAGWLARRRGSFVASFQWVLGVQEMKRRLAESRICPDDG